MFAAVLSLLIVVLGVASLLRLPIRELPDVDSAVVGVGTTYTGAAPEIVDTEITELIEGAVAGIAGIKTISSTSQRGRGRTVIEFEPGPRTSTRRRTTCATRSPGCAATCPTRSTSRRSPRATAIPTR